VTFDLLSALTSLGHPRVLVLGDLMLDRYTVGNAERISQESPVIVLRADEREARLGGAANVCNMLRGLECAVTIAGVVGDDAAGRELRALLEQAGCDTSLALVDPARPTTVKERFVGRAAGRHRSQILRVDSETCDALPAEIEDRLALAIAEQIVQCDIVIVSDYAKGVCSPRLMRSVIHAARCAGVRVIVDPQRGGDWSMYRGATMLKPNRVETELAIGRKIKSTVDATDAGLELCRKFDLQLAVVTLDRDGMCLVSADGRGEVFPISPRPVYDITGAGDMVIAMLGTALASGIDAAHAVRLANVAAGLEVERLGVAVIPKADIERELVNLGRPGGRKIVTLDAAAGALAEHRRRGEKVVFTNGCFDLLHVGHVTYLAQAKALGDLLVVGVNSDAGVRRIKGPSRPVINEQDRAAMLAALAAVDYVVVFDEDTPHRMLHALKPDVLVKGGTYAPHEVVGHEIVTAYGGRVCVAGVVDGISTTNILASLRHKQPIADDSPPTLRRAG
jgi:D-beta-D-heptose 7-phosphate kinase/D-beta-D-heptose 1-phosphate adenosyltransferase